MWGSDTETQTSLAGSPQPLQGSITMHSEYRGLSKTTPLSPFPFSHYPANNTEA